MKPLNQYFDHTILKAGATESDIMKLCREAREYEFYAVCVAGAFVATAARELVNSPVKIASVIGFPLGNASTETKVFETVDACVKGAGEIDMVLNIGALKDGRYSYVKNEITAIVTTAQKYGAEVKVILETCLLTDEEIVKACGLAIEAGAAYVKTSTGFGKDGAKPHHVALMKKVAGDQIKVKASGGIRDLLTAREMIHLGADRIGCSNSVAIMDAAK